MWQNVYRITLALILLTPIAGLARQASSYHGPRIGLQGADMGFSMARGSRDFNGLDSRTANLYNFHADVQLSLLAMTLSSWGIFESSNRLRIGDYWRAELIAGWILEEQNDVVPGGEVDLAGGDGILAGVFAAGVQANYLVSDMLEVGGVVAKATWNTTMGFGNAYHRALKPSDAPYPLLWIGRARFGSLVGEYQTSATAKFEGTDGDYFSGRNYQYQHGYSSLRLRYFRSGGNASLGVGLDRYYYRVYKDASETWTVPYADRAVTSIRVTFGYSV